MQTVLSQPGKQLRECQANENDLFHHSSLGLWEAMSALINVENIRGTEIKWADAHLTCLLPLLRIAHQSCFILGVLSLPELTGPNMSSGEKEVRFSARLRWEIHLQWFWLCGVLPRLKAGRRGWYERPVKFSILIRTYMEKYKCILCARTLISSEEKTPNSILDTPEIYILDGGGGRWSTCVGNFLSV